MGRRRKARAALRTAIGDALTLLREADLSAPAGLPAEPLPSLLAECEALTREPLPEEPVRLLHHFACTGGTLIARCVASLPNTILLSEIDPLSTVYWPVPRPGPFRISDDRARFRPTDVLMALRTSLRPVPDATIVESFVASIRAARDSLAREGRSLVIRDHPHSLFCTDAEAGERATVAEMLAAALPVRAVVTVRHPLDSFLGLDANGWRDFSPFTVLDYVRRYDRFLDRHAGVPTIRYEDFVAAPAAVLAEIARTLALPYAPAALELFPSVVLSGDSGRSGAEIVERARRPIPDAIARELRDCPPFDELCRRLGYPAETVAR